MGLRSTWVWAAVALAALVSGCETTTLRSAWFDTEFTGPPMRKIVVLGGGISSTDSRVFEDQFVEKLRAAGVDAVAGYTLGVIRARMAQVMLSASELMCSRFGLRTNSTRNTRRYSSGKWM